ncbi:unnamed protein product [Polarella glacialis]|uniref:alpha-amylase n=1 Tax=Polarella glacialis TaxID=89957 RepID=A0A813HVL9_POLGL|nr:unnamed protein product [Polarella glacialis]
MGIDEILESVGADVDLEREPGRVGRWLLGKTFGVIRVHILVSVGYVASPVAEFLTLITATEWGLRGATNVPSWLTRLIGTTMDPPMLNMLLFAVNSLAFAVSAPMWAALSRRMQPRQLMSASLLLQIPLLATFLPIKPNLALAIVLVAANGIVSSASTLFLVFNFMMSIKADMSNYALRMGALEMVRYVVSWSLTGYIFLASPSSNSGTAAQPLPAEVKLLLLPIALLMVLMTTIPGILLSFAPGPYHRDRFPGWDLELFWRKRSFVLLFISECVGSLALFPGTCYISWWLDNGWSNSDLAGLSYVFALLLAVGTALWARALSSASVHGFSFLVGAAVLLAPPMMLRAVAEDEVATVTNYGRSHWALAISVSSLYLEGVRSSAIWTAKIRILNSRWRLLSYGTLLQTASHVCAFLSPILCELLARRGGATFVTRNQKELADAIIMSCVPLGVVQFAFQVLATPIIYKDLGISVGSERSGHSVRFRWFRIHRVLKKGPVLFAFCACIALSAALLSTMYYILGQPLTVDRILRCERPLTANCTVIVDEVDKRPASHAHWHYGPNRFGQNTTGTYNCLSRMREVGGDTFVFWGYGRCQVQKCGDKASLFRESSSEVSGSADVWSRFCDMARPNLVAVHLLEWPWEDVGRECETYLGPGGFNAVQVSPPSEHNLGDSWAVRYQPVSYLLESRGGSATEFAAMVSKCRAAGVNVMVDAVLNHMAGPFVFTPRKDRGKQCGQATDTDKTSTSKCLGWAGTEYGNRQFPNGRSNLDAFDPEMFHHYPGNVKSNCGLPPWTNNKRLCDMYGLPDLDTESVGVQRMLASYLFNLLEIGVTTLRMDAAMNIYPESLAQILAQAPWEFVVQEYYPDSFQNQDTAKKASSLGSATDFTFGQRVAQSVFDTKHDGVHWKDRSDRFAELLQLQPARQANCPYKICKSPYPSSRALIFLDNHDQQRERWKPEVPGQPPANPVCFWDGQDKGLLLGLPKTIKQQCCSCQKTPRTTLSFKGGFVVSCKVVCLLCHCVFGSPAGYRQLPAHLQARAGVSPSPALSLGPQLFVVVIVVCHKVASYYFKGACARGAGERVLCKPIRDTQGFYVFFLSGGIFRQHRRWFVFQERKCRCYVALYHEFIKNSMTFKHIRRKMPHIMKRSEENQGHPKMFKEIQRISKDIGRFIGEEEKRREEKIMRKKRSEEKKREENI